MREGGAASKWLSAGREIAARGLWFPALVFVGHVIASQFLLVYEALPVLDVPVHLIGGFAIAFFFSVVIDSLSKRGLIVVPDPPLRLVLLFALVCTAAVFWEFAEYISDHTIGTNAQAGLEDTLFDMVMGIAGGLAYLPLGRF